MELRFVTEAPTITVQAEQQLDHAGVLEMARWLQEHRPDCVPDEGFNSTFDLLPHDGTEVVAPGVPGEFPATVRSLTDNELLVEIAGRECYHSFAEKAGKKSNKEYIENTQKGVIPHASIMYHAQMTFFIGDISMRVARELQRNYIGHAKDEEGSPSQESTRFTHHYGWYVVQPYILRLPEDFRQYELERFEAQMRIEHKAYEDFIERQMATYRFEHHQEPKGLDRKRIYEAAAGYLPMQASTSFVWTSNPIALGKLFRERCDEAADLEFSRFAKKWRALCRHRWPNLFLAKGTDEQ